MKEPSPEVAVRGSERPVLRPHWVEDILPNLPVLLMDDVEVLTVEALEGDSDASGLDATGEILEVDAPEGVAAPADVALPARVAAPEVETTPGPAAVQVDEEFTDEDDEDDELDTLPGLELHLLDHPALRPSRIVDRPTSLRVAHEWTSPSTAGGDASVSFSDDTSSDGLLSSLPEVESAEIVPIDPLDEELEAELGDAWEMPPQGPAERGEELDLPLSGWGFQQELRLAEEVGTTRRGRGVRLLEDASELELTPLPGATALPDPHTAEHGPVEATVRSRPLSPVAPELEDTNRLPEQEVENILAELTGGDSAGAPPGASPRATDGVSFWDVSQQALPRPASPLEMLDDREPPARGLEVSAPERALQLPQVDDQIEAFESPPWPADPEKAESTRRVVESADEVLRTSRLELEQAAAALSGWSVHAEPSVATPSRTGLREEELRWLDELAARVMPRDQSEPGLQKGFDGPLALVDEPAPELMEEPAPELMDEPAPELMDEPAPELMEEPAPELMEEPAPEVVEEPRPELMEEPAPDSEGMQLAPEVEDEAPAVVEEVPPPAWSTRGSRVPWQEEPDDAEDEVGADSDKDEWDIPTQPELFVPVMAPSEGDDVNLELDSGDFTPAGVRPPMPPPVFDTEDEDDEPDLFAWASEDEDLRPEWEGAAPAAPAPEQGGHPTDAQPESRAAAPPVSDEEDLDPISLVFGDEDRGATPDHLAAAATHAQRRAAADRLPWFEPEAWLDEDRLPVPARRQSAPTSAPTLPTPSPEDLARAMAEIEGPTLIDVTLVGAGAGAITTGGSRGYSATLWELPEGDFEASPTANTLDDVRAEVTLPTPSLAQAAAEVSEAEPEELEVEAVEPSVQDDLTQALDDAHTEAIPQEPTQVVPLELTAVDGAPFLAEDALLRRALGGLDATDPGPTAVERLAVGPSRQVDPLADALVELEGQGEDPVALALAELEGGHPLPPSSMRVEVEPSQHDPIAQVLAELEESSGRPFSVSRLEPAPSAPMRAAPPALESAPAEVDALVLALAELEGRAPATSEEAIDPLQAAVAELEGAAAITEEAPPTDELRRLGLALGDLAPARKGAGRTASRDPWGEPWEVAPGLGGSTPPPRKESQEWALPQERPVERRVADDPVAEALRVLEQAGAGWYPQGEPNPPGPTSAGAASGWRYAPTRLSRSEQDPWVTGSEPGATSSRPPSAELPMGGAAGAPRPRALSPWDEPSTTQSWSPPSEAPAARPRGRIGDRRRAPRVLGIEGKVYFRRRGRIATGELIDLSIGGAAIQTRTPAPRGFSIPLALELPGITRPLRCQVMVVWSEEGEETRAGSTPGAMGVSFEKIEGDGAQLLASFLAEHL